MTAPVNPFDQFPTIDTTKPKVLPPANFSPAAASADGKGVDSVAGFAPGQDYGWGTSGDITDAQRAGARRYADSLKANTTNGSYEGMLQGSLFQDPRLAEALGVTNARSYYSQPDTTMTAPNTSAPATPMDPFAQFTAPKAFGLPAQGTPNAPVMGGVGDGVTTSGAGVLPIGAGMTGTDGVTTVDKTINDPFGGADGVTATGPGQILTEPAGNFGGGGTFNALASAMGLNGGQAAASPMGGGVPNGIRPLRRPSGLQNGRAPTGNFGGNGIRPLRRLNPTIGGAPQAPASGPGSASGGGPGAPGSLLSY